VVVVVCPTILRTIDVVQTPVDVTVICVADTSTSTNLPANNSDLVAVLGVTLPTSAVRLKLGPVSAPKPELSVTNIFIFYIYSFIIFYNPS
jgi:hypothetical protein